MTNTKLDELLAEAGIDKNAVKFEDRTHFPYVLYVTWGDEWRWVDLGKYEGAN